VGLLCCLSLAFGAIVARLVVLQVNQADALQMRALDQRLREVELPAWRGQIVDRSGEPFALSVEARDVYADPRYVVDPWETAVSMAPILGLGVRDLLAKLTADTTFVYLDRQVDLDVARRLEALDLPGIGFLPTSKRVYPAGPLAAQVVGFVNVDGVGISGLELQYQSLLAGKPGERTQELAEDGRPIAGGIDVETPAVPGSDLVTTIDRYFQYRVQAALEDAVHRNRALGGTVVVMDPRTGEILAMASYPWFDPNAPGDSRPATWRNKAVTDAWEPGSVNKVVTAAAAVEEHALPLDQRIAVPDEMQVGTFTIHDSDPHPVEQMTLGDIIARSSNMGAVLVARRLGSFEMAKYLAAFGLGRATGVGFPGESAGIVPPIDRWNVTTLATIAYGQGISVTPLQMVSVYATIANGGRWVQPRLVDGWVGPDGTYHAASGSQTHRVVSEETARIVTRMLAYAVQGGTGTAAQIPGYQVAGKTGTARIPLPDGSGYYTDRSIASFIGFLPASQPRVVIAAILDRPATVYGGVAAAPLFRQIARYAIERMSIAPARWVRLPPHALPAP
jgi:cell division protein FtsI (penicillin-binding protein 3)